MHTEHFQHQPCLEILTVYQEGMKHSPLKLFFKEGDSRDRMESPEGSHWVVGYPQDGVLWHTGDKYGAVNLNRPGVVAQIIKYARQHGWQPDVMKRPFEVSNGFAWIERIEFPEPKER